MYGITNFLLKHSKSNYFDKNKMEKSLLPLYLNNSIFDLYFTLYLTFMKCYKKKSFQKVCGDNMYLTLF